MTRRWLWLALTTGCGGEETFVPEEPPPFQDGVVVDDTQISVEELPCSTMSGVSSNVAIQNPLAEVVRIYWRDDACEEVLYNTLSPGGGYSQGTFTGHVWVARRDADGALLDHHVVVGANELWSVTP